MTFFVDLFVKEMIVKIQPNCNGPHNMQMKFMTCLVKMFILQGFAKFD